MKPFIEHVLQHKTFISDHPPKQQLIKVVIKPVLVLSEAID